MRLTGHNQNIQHIQDNKKSSLQGTELETFRSKCDRFKRGKFMSLDGNNFLSVKNMWEKSESIPSRNYELNLILKHHEADTPWNIPFKIKEVIELLIAVKAEKDWSSDEAFKQINFEKDILPKINDEIILEKIKKSPVIEKDHLKVKDEFKKRLKYIFSANLDFPIIINGSHKILDGNHRLIQTAIRDISTIKAKEYTLPPGNEDIYFSDQEWESLKKQLFNKK